MEFKTGKAKMECNHDWVNGPFQVVILADNEGEKYIVPPMAFYKVEHCTKCGTLRLPTELREFGK